MGPQFRGFRWSADPPNLNVQRSKYHVKNIISELIINEFTGICAVYKIHQKLKPSNIDKITLYVTSINTDYIKAGYGNETHPGSLN